MMLGFLCIPLMFLIIVIAEPVIVVLYTDKWIEATPYLQVLCFTGIFVSLQAVNANVINSLGYSGLYFKWSIVKTLLLLLIVWIGHYWGIIGLLSSLVFYNFSEYVINAVLASRFTHYTLWQQARDLMPILLSSGMIALVVWPLRYIIYNYLILLIIQFFVFVVLYVGVSYLIDKTMMSQLLSLKKRY